MGGGGENRFYLNEICFYNLKYCIKNTVYNVLIKMWSSNESSLKFWERNFKSLHEAKRENYLTKSKKEACLVWAYN